jgi:hypothetical protein
LEDFIMASELTTTNQLAPVVPVVSTVVRDLDWIRTHAIIALITVVIIAGSIMGGIAVFEDLIERHDARVAAAQLKKEGVDTSAQQALLAQLAQEHADNVQRDAQQTQLIASLVAQMSQQRAATAKQVATDATLDASDAAARLAQQTKAGPGDVTVANNAVTMSLPMTRNVVADLDELTQAQSDVSNLTSQLGAQQILTSDAKVELGTANQVIAADKTELIATIKADNAACDVKLDKQAAKARKRTFWTVLATAAGMGILFAK